MIGYECFFKYKKKHIKAMKCFVRKVTHKKVQIYENKILSFYYVTYYLKKVIRYIFLLRKTEILEIYIF